MGVFLADFLGEGAGRWESWAVGGAYKSPCSPAGAGPKLFFRPNDLKVCWHSFGAKRQAE